MGYAGASSDLATTLQPIIGNSPLAPGRRERARRSRARGARQAAAPVPPQRRGLARLASKHPPNGEPRRVGGGGAVPLGPPTSSLRRTQIGSQSDCLGVPAIFGPVVQMEFRT